ncbi:MULTISPECIES: hypothetical protein [Burkholderia]|uniref:hypothetical protein n=1 Tax=Burkholderia TaxID=32008 RepID=UPI001CF1004A|nr:MULTISPECIES: hypothetical protein [Burkholderia]MCA8171556.1 hypothetical protein [Burkholderia gladioli]
MTALRARARRTACHDHRQPHRHRYAGVARPAHRAHPFIESSLPIESHGPAIKKVSNAFDVLYSNRENQNAPSAMPNVRDMGETLAHGRLPHRFARTSRSCIHPEPCMSDPIASFRLPASLSRQALAAIPAPIGDDDFSTAQIEFMQQVFAYAEHLRVAGRPTPLSDAFLGAFVGLFEVIDMNSREDALRCAWQFREIVTLLVPNATPAGEPRPPVAPDTPQ